MFRFFSVGFSFSFGFRGFRGLVAFVFVFINWRLIRERVKNEYIVMVIIWRRGSRVEWDSEKCRFCF